MGGGRDPAAVSNHRPVNRRDIGGTFRDHLQQLGGRSA